jgi:hypothetical protein
MKNLESFGSIRHYRYLINRVKDDKHLWQKVAHILNKLRRDLRPWQVVHRETQLKEGEKYFIQALKDSRLPKDVKFYLRWGVMLEFGFKLDNA